MTEDTTDDNTPTRQALSGTMRDWLSHRVATTPDHRALIYAPTGDSWTFRELDSLVSETAGQLAALGVKAGDHLGVLLEPGVEYVRLIHAAGRLGVTLVPLSERLTPGEVARNLEIADVTALVCGDSTESTAVEATVDVPVVSVDEPRWEGVINLSSIAPKSTTPAQWNLSDTMLLLFTSGTTGTPKAVRLTMGNVLANAVASSFRLGLSPGDRWLVTLSLHHMGGIGPILRSPLYGTTIVLRDGFDAGGAADDIGKYDVTGVSVVPTMLKRMLDSRGTLSDSLRVVLLGGAPASEELVERCRNYSVPVYPTYGMTETASQIATATPREAFSSIGTVGRQLFFVDLDIVNDDGTLVEPGTAGEIVVSGLTVSPGYYGDPEATADAFTDAGLRTGDIGYRDDDGLLYVLNRKDDRIITGGENVDPGEVVHVLRQYPAIDDAVVLGIPDAEWGERVSALVVLSDPEMRLDRSALDAFCREHLAGFKVPRLVEPTDELPRTVSGTIDREKVRERLQASQPVTEAEPEWTGDPQGDGAIGADPTVVADAERGDEEDAEEREPTPADESDEPEPAGVTESTNSRDSQGNESDVPDEDDDKEGPEDSADESEMTDDGGIDASDDSEGGSGGADGGSDGDADAGGNDGDADAEARTTHHDEE
ncbi:o-succinylbenzoate--CoA ligase [Haloferax sp. MBLA0076]|uniref:2-succinylbenzoate--CoA ligase n=1 Tax=Haloferax litoreum TaxID=2666140 RepID=A0A6A8GII5_9EURY|nr:MULTISPECIES: o-succinylbenzoate--CoA ligase [Haloferax]KAB1194400.1 o-succinylbenzoate--CoA ligase [Haloferax sp. CBA1148]MRX22965.1 o-succinylbenzoate--CoA ligase [Haloferax litoreum]